MSNHIHNVEQYIIEKLLRQDWQDIQDATGDSSNVRKNNANSKWLKNSATSRGKTFYRAIGMVSFLQNRTNAKETIVVLNGTSGFFAGANSISFSKSPGSTYIDKIQNSSKYDTCLLSEFNSAISRLGKEQVSYELMAIAIEFNKYDKSKESIMELFRGKWGEVYDALPNELKKIVKNRFDPNLKEALNSLTKKISLEDANLQIKNVLESEFRKIFKSDELVKALRIVTRVFTGGITSPKAIKTLAVELKGVSKINVGNTYISGFKKSKKKTNTLKKLKSI